MENIVNINIDNSAGVATIDIEGTIGAPDYSGVGKVATYEAFKGKIEEVKSQNVRKVVVNIRSTGGDVQDALLIYDALKEIGCKVETICYGYTASAATIIAQAASAGERKMSANGLYLIHQASTYADGNANELDAKADLLKKTDERIAAIYAAASGRPAEEFAALMGENNGNGKWLSAEEALAAGLIDTIVNATTINNKFNPEEQGQRLVLNELIRDNRVNHVCPADYSESSEIDTIVKTIIDKVVMDQRLAELEVAREERQ